MSWASGSKQSLNIQCLSKYVPKSYKTSEAESTIHFEKRSLKKFVVIVIISIPDPFNGFHKNAKEPFGIFGPEGERRFLVAVKRVV